MKSLMKLISMVLLTLFALTANLKAQNQKISEASNSKKIWEKIAPFFTPASEYKDQEPGGYDQSPYTYSHA